MEKDHLLRVVTVVDQGLQELGDGVQDVRGGKAGRGRGGGRDRKRRGGRGRGMEGKRGGEGASIVRCMCVGDREGASSDRSGKEYKARATGTVTIIVHNTQLS